MPKVKFKHTFWALGEYCPSKNEVKLDLKREVNFLRIYLHELIHAEHPEWGETRVRRETTKRWRKMTYYQIYLLGRRLFNREWR